MIGSVAVGVSTRVGNQTEFLVDGTLEVRATVLEDPIVVCIVVDRTSTLRTKIVIVERAPAIRSGHKWDDSCKGQHSDGDGLLRREQHVLVVGNDSLGRSVDWEEDDDASFVQNWRLGEQLLYTRLPLRRTMDPLQESCRLPC